ncbi:hypothetical protein GCM10025868_23820 [Angustibacter aerolatus]|uniref:Uncharacterized protein n=1 Tax=Angustibacter aerolatus TaxID=1162965 RepID=A0ABQ6JFZ2_9ACTN|nr:hypothetical protein GCM10025868_23820 [Angustibacter aerolatus]
MIMSTPGAMPSVIRPSTVAENGSGVVPRSTVQPVPVRPSTAEAVGSTEGQARGWGSGAACADCAVTAVSPAASTAVVTNGTSAPGRFMQDSPEWCGPGTSRPLSHRR